MPALALDLDERSRRLSERVDALGRALNAAGAGAETTSRLLETAATAALHALTLDVMLARVSQPAPAAGLTPAPTAETPPIAAAA